MLYMLEGADAGAGAFILGAILDTGRFTAAGASSRASVSAVGTRQAADGGRFAPLPLIFIPHFGTSRFATPSELISARARRVTACRAAHVEPRFLGRGFTGAVSSKATVDDTVFVRHDSITSRRSRRRPLSPSASTFSMPGPI